MNSVLKNSVNHRVFERTLRPLVFRGACLSERHCCPQARLVCWAPSPVSPGDGPERQRRHRVRSSSVWGFVTRSVGPAGASRHPTLFLRLTSDQVGIPAELKHINKRRKRNQQGLPQ
ncbi:hypothetical protein IFM46972_10165 [Aspergillus udagawae]|uniref:Uncharacterized protein n=1 Tax=Aspergillus udagawae TaxID=91492 RepID=A0A8H3SAU0_9EURO|nr:hypothetical protein IFM46972_10165 [Aspergillus udagawae]